MLVAMDGLRESESKAAGANIKGAAIRTFLLWYEQQHRSNTLADAVATAPAAYRTLLDPTREALGILPSNWYPAPLIHHIMDRVIATLSPTQRTELAREGARVVMETTLRGVYRLLFDLVATPERYARYAQRMWNTYHDTGTNVITSTGPGRQRSILQGWRGHHRFICDMNLAAIEATYREMGCRNVHASRASCVSDGASFCTTDIEWSI